MIWNQFATTWSLSKANKNAVIPAFNDNSNF